MEIAAEIVTAKIENYLIWLRGRARSGTAGLALKLEQTVIALSHCESVNEVLGHEGGAAKLLFQAVNALVREEEGQAFFSGKKPDLPLPG